MKKLFQVEVEVRTAKEERLTESELARYLRTDDFISMSTVITIKDITDDIEEVTEQTTYRRLLGKVQKETDADSCSAWAGALRSFCDAIRTRNGG